MSSTRSAKAAAAAAAAAKEVAMLRRTTNIRQSKANSHKRSWRRRRWQQRSTARQWRPKLAGKGTRRRVRAQQWLQLPWLTCKMTRASGGLGTKRRRVYGLTPQTDLGGAAASEARGLTGRQRCGANSRGPGASVAPLRKPRSTRVRSVSSAKRTQSTRMRRERMSRQMRHTRSELTSRWSPRRFGLRTGQLKPTSLVCMLRMNQRQRRIKQGEHKAQEQAGQIVPLRSG